MKNITLKQLKDGAELPNIIYKTDSYVVLSKENMILHCGTLNSLKALPSYYDECKVTVREYDIYLADNTREDYTFEI